MKVYVASSWRNALQPSIVALLREHGFEVYDFRNPAPGNQGFAWSAIDPAWQGWSTEQFRDALRHPLAERGFQFDMDALAACDACVLVQPCGRSAHLEAGFAVGAGKPLFVIMQPGNEPELMLKMHERVMPGGLFIGTDGLIESLNAWRADVAVRPLNEGKA